METTARKILVVDDDNTVRTLVVRYFTHCGLEALPAASGLEAIGCLQKHSTNIALVLLDMTMPVMDGEQTFAALHQLQPDLPFIIYTGDCSSDALNRLLATGLCGHVFKPCALDVLVDQVQRRLEQPTGTGPAARAVAMC